MEIKRDNNLKKDLKKGQVSGWMDRRTGDESSSSSAAPASTGYIYI